MKTFLIGRLTARRKGRTKPTRRRNERGAALISTLLISTLLLAAGGALVMTTSLSATNAVDSTAEMQAYYAAEAGLQATLNVLRGHVPPSPLFNTSNPSSNDNKLTYRRAVALSTSNLSGDTATVPRLSRWLQYSSTHPDRITLSNPYSTLNGTAYSVTVSDPDNSATVSYTPSGIFPNSTSSPQTSQTFNGAPGNNWVRISYVAPTTSPVVLPNGGSYAATLGGLRVEANGSGAIVPSTPLRLTVNQTAPWTGTITLDCTVSSLGGVVTSSTNNVVVTFPTTSFSLNNVGYTLTGGASITLGAANVNGGLTTVAVSVTPPEPRRLLVRTIGYGPRGARKQLQAMVRRFGFQIAAPSPIVIRGADDGISPMTFDLGSSNAKFYTGQDNASAEPQRPTVAINLHDWTVADAGIKKGATVASPQLSILDITPPPPLLSWPLTLIPIPSAVPPTAQTPAFLVTADAARSFLRDAELAARGMGRYFSGPYSGLAGGLDDPQYTFIDGDCTLEGGAGMLIVTGNLVINGNNDFKGIILVLGNGHVTRTGGGNGNILGAWIVARFNRTSGNFLAPTFNVSGGGNGTFQFDSRWVREANNTTGRLVLGVSEY